jgi:DNA modification methylase
MRESAAPRRGTATSAFGVSRRENHDASDFYARFSAPDLSDDHAVSPRKAIDQVFCGDSRAMAQIDDASVALVVTSPPYFAGKEYERALGEGHIPATYADYLQMLEDVLAECVRTLEPGGRIAVNVANLGRRPYRSLSADITTILQDRLRLLLRGEVIWVKARGAGGNCAWGSFQKPANPVLRDLTERVIIAGKGRFDRAIKPEKRAKQGLPHEATVTRDEFMEATTDLWELPTESATRLGHPAPFPVALPERLIELHTYRGDLVLDPFMGSGSTGVAAVRTGRHFVGYDTDPVYVEAATTRIEAARTEMVDGAASVSEDRAVVAEAVAAGVAAKELAATVLREAGFAELRKDPRLPAGLTADLAAVDPGGRIWWFDVVGGFTTSRPGLRRAELLWRTLAKAAVIAESGAETPFVVLTSALPTNAAGGRAALDVLRGPGRPIREVLVMQDPTTISRLRELAAQ